ncbi:hypothetical protein A2U01_0064853, partial [Trifolium medium]|nr:hypothetical protein [Trifolium medium]
MCKEKKVHANVDQFFEDVIDVAGNRHYGFRPISELLKKFIDDYNIIRLELTIELNKPKDRYLALFGSQGRFSEVKHALTLA